MFESEELSKTSGGNLSKLAYLMGQWQEFRKWEEEQHLELKSDLKVLNKKVDSLRLWRASMLGASSVLGALFGLLAGYLIK